MVKKESKKERKNKQNPNKIDIDKWQCEQMVFDVCLPNVNEKREIDNDFQ